MVLLVAVGCRSSGGSIQVEKAGLEPDVRAFIHVNERMKISVPGIYSIGDVTGKPMLALEMGADWKDIGLNIHPHPTLAESFTIAAENADGSITDVLNPGK